MKSRRVLGEGGGMPDFPGHIMVPWCLVQHLMLVLAPGASSSQGKKVVTELGSYLLLGMALCVDLHKLADKVSSEGSFVLTYKLLLKGAPEVELPIETLVRAREQLVNAIGSFAGNRKVERSLLKVVDSYLPKTQ